MEDYRRKTKSYFTRTYRTSQIKDGESVDDLLRSFWELESMGITESKSRVFTPDEKAALDHGRKTKQKTDGRYEIGIPWRQGEPSFDDNYEMALSRLKTQEKSLLKKGPKISEAYDQVIKDYEKKGYIIKVPKTEESQWFLPHFPVIREDKKTTKVRIVFDPAAKYNGKSLNDATLPGPKLQREFVDVLTRFRQAPIDLSVDISEMFLQVGISSKDRPYHRFLWREFDNTRDPDVYHFSRVLFGNTASPFCAQCILQTHAQEHSATYPSAAVRDIESNALRESRQKYKSEMTVKLEMEQSVWGLTSMI